MNQVQSWAEQRIESLGIILGQEVRELDLSDDRLESVLLNLSNDESWMSFEQDLSQRQLQVYDLKPERVRLDSTSISGFWNEDKEGLFRSGHSKDHRPDLPQLKLMMATLDPLGLPIASEIVAGNSADDPLDEPAVAQVRKTLGQSGMLYVGDCKMGSIGTRYFIQAGDDYYLCPLSKTQVSLEELKKYASESKEAGIELENISYAYANGKTVVIAKGYEQVYSCTIKQGESEISWLERRLIVYSIIHGQSQKQALQSRIEKAQQNLELLNQKRPGKKPFKDLQEFIQAAEEIITKNRVQSLFDLSFTENIEQIHQRKYKERPAGVIEKRTWKVEYTIESDKVEQQMELLGWRVYATNHPEKELPLADAVVAYRQEYLIEHCFGRLKGQPLSLRPMFLQREDHIKGLIKVIVNRIKAINFSRISSKTSLASR